MEKVVSGTNRPRRRFGIVGGGLVGLGTAYRLQAAFPDDTVVVWEKEATAGAHQSTHNSGVLHAGLYYKPGSLKARLAVTGIRQMIQFCRENAIAHEICGKLVVATDESELGRLHTLLDRGIANGLKGLRYLDHNGLREIEPHAAGIAAVAVPEEGIVDYRAVVNALVATIAARGGIVRVNSPVRLLERRQDRWVVGLATEFDECDFLVNCAGLNCDRVAALANTPPSTRIIPFRGEYYELRPDRQYLVRNLIYPVPNPAYPFLGVHFTRLVHGGIEAGPNAILTLAREGYRRGSFTARDAWEAVSFSGLWRFAARHGRMCLEEVARSYSRRLFCRSLQKLVPEVRTTDLVPGTTGVRAQAMTRTGELVQDFDLLERPDSIHVINAPSPGATASLAIGEYVAGKVATILGKRTAAAEPVGSI